MASLINVWSTKLKFLGASLGLYCTDSAYSKLLQILDRWTDAPKKIMHFLDVEGVWPNISEKQPMRTHFFWIAVPYLLSTVACYRSKGHVPTKGKTVERAYS